MCPPPSLIGLDVSVTHWRASIKFSTTYLNLSFDSRKDWMLRILLISNWSLDWIRFNFLLNLFPLNWKMEPILPSFLPMGSNVCSNPKQPGGWHPRWPVPRLSSGCCAATARRQPALTDKTSCGGTCVRITNIYHLYFYIYNLRKASLRVSHQAQVGTIEGELRPGAGRRDL